MDRKLRYKLPPTTITDKLVSQNARRLKALEDQKRRRAEKFDSTRQLDLFADLSLGASDDEGDLNPPEGPEILREGLVSYAPMLASRSNAEATTTDTRVEKKRRGKGKRKGQSKGQNRKPSKWANQCMYAELLEMIDTDVWSMGSNGTVHDGLPEDLEKGWVCVAPVPVGKRCLALVTAAPNGISPNTTLRSRLLGKALLPRFPSSLPPSTVLDCILDTNWKDNGILHVLDVIKWKGQDIGDCETPFRLWWRDTRLAELLPSPAPSNSSATPNTADLSATAPLFPDAPGGTRYQFPYPNTLIPVPYYTDTSLVNLHSQIIPLARSSRAVPVNLPLSSSTGTDMAVDTGNEPSGALASVSSDGMLLYVSEASYEPGTSPLSSWVPIEYAEDGPDGEMKQCQRPLDQFDLIVQRRLSVRSDTKPDIEM